MESGRGDGQDGDARRHAGPPPGIPFHRIPGDLDVVLLNGRSGGDVGRRAAAEGGVVYVGNGEDGLGAGIGGAEAGGEE